jgi:pyruvate,water dikinase
MDGRLNVVPLEAADGEPVFGGKAVSLGAALRAGLPVPPGVALSAAFVDRVAAADASALALLESPDVAGAISSPRLAVRSSAVGEDSADASFAGQHATKLNVTRLQVPVAVRAVWDSARSDAALGYRARKGLPAEPRIGAVVQTLVEPIAAGVMFTLNPMTGADERVIEAAWGLGEAVVSGAVTPDRYRLDRSGRLVEFTAGHKDVKVWYDEGEGTIEIAVAADLHAVPCLRTSHLEALHDLAERCHRVWGPSLDIEWAVAAGDRIYLLQCRPITVTRPST